MPTYTHNLGTEFQKNTAFLDRKSLMNVLEIGAYQGQTSNFIVDNLLLPGGTLTCVDPLDPQYQLDNEPEMFKGQYERFIENTEANKDRIFLVRKKSEDVLHQFRENTYDLAFVDGHHRYNTVYYDGTECFKLVKVGGYILFDDYLWNNATFEVKRAIDKVLQENPNYRLLLKLNQVLIQKLPEGAPTEDGQDEYQNKQIEKLFNRDTIYGAYCNLDVREDRNLKMIEELKRVDLEIPIVRQRSFPWQELWDKFSEEEKENCMVMHRRTPGAIGCYYSQMEVMREALRQGKHAIVLEDDLIFCDDLPARLKIIFKFLNQHEWDVFWFGGTYHKEHHWHVAVEGRHTHPDLQQCNCNLNRDWEPTRNPHIVRCYGAFSTHAYMVNKNRIEHILMLLERNMRISMGVDWSFILEQPNLECYAFDPGCIKQFDSMSNISNGWAAQSGFANLGPHFFQPSMNYK